MLVLVVAAALIIPLHAIKNKIKDPIKIFRLTFDIILFASVNMIFRRTPLYSFF